jgi:hypothetical protein
MSEPTAPALLPVATLRMDLVARVGRVVGHVPVGTNDLLSVLTHPDVIAHTRRFIDATEQSDDGR